MNRKSETWSSSPYFPKHPFWNTHTHTHTHTHTRTETHTWIYSFSILSPPPLPPFLPSREGYTPLQLRGSPSSWPALHIWSLFSPPSFCLIISSLLDTFPSGGHLTGSVAYKYTSLHEWQPCHGKGACITQQSYKPCHGGPHKRMGHSEVFSQNVVHWRRKWQPTLVLLPGEAHEHYEKAKIYDIGRWTSQVKRCPICYWGRAEGNY